MSVRCVPERWLVGALLVLGPILSLAPAGAQDAEPLAPLEKATLRRPESHVVLRGEQVPALVGQTRELLRLFAWKDGSLQPVPLQIDERTSTGAYVLERGSPRLTDAKPEFDDNDELVFMAEDAGDRLPLARLQLGQLLARELELKDASPAAPGSKPGRAWAYLVAIRPDPAAPSGPPQPRRDYVSLIEEQGEVVGWKSGRVLAKGAADGNFLHLSELRYDKAGKPGADVLDRVKLRLDASYLFTDLVRRHDEVRAAVGGWTDGPVRVLADLRLETYLIWGHWIRPPDEQTPCQLKLYGNRLELELAVRLPVDLESDAASNLRVSLDFAPGGQRISVWSDKTERRWRSGSSHRSRLRDLDRSFPAWICASSAEGSLMWRFSPGKEWREGRRHQLYLADDQIPDPPEDVPGSYANTGFRLDLQGLKAGTYRARMTVQFGPPISPGQEAQLTEPERPLEVTVRGPEAAATTGSGR